MIDHEITISTRNPTNIIDTLRGMADKLESGEFIHVSGGIVVDIDPVRDGNSMTLTANLKVLKRPPEVEIADGVDWFIASWPDGTWCDWSDRDEMTHMSDDYEKQRVLSYDEGFVPVRTERVKS